MFFNLFIKSPTKHLYLYPARLQSQTWENPPRRFEEAVLLPHCRILAIATK